MHWINLDSAARFDALLETEKVFAVFKHSTRCSISTNARYRLEREWIFDIPVYEVDVLRQRELSMHIAERSGIRHESPQLILFRDGQPVYHGSHTFIFVSEIESELIQN